MKRKKGQSERDWGGEMVKRRTLVVGLFDTGGLDRIRDEDFLGFHLPSTVCELHKKNWSLFR